MHACIHTLCTHIQCTHTHTRTCACTHRTHIQACMCACTHANTKNKHFLSLSHTHVHTHTHTHTHTEPHKQPHTYSNCVFSVMNRFTSVHVMCRYVLCLKKMKINISADVISPISGSCGTYLPGRCVDGTAFETYKAKDNLFLFALHHEKHITQLCQ